MFLRHGAPSRAENSFLENLRLFVGAQLDNDTPAGQLLISTCHEARRLLPAMGHEDAERVADVIIEEVCEARIRQGKPKPRRGSECRIIKFPGRSTA